MGELIFDDALHKYTLCGVELPSVTHICRYLTVDVDKSRPWLRDVAANRGTRVHEVCAEIDMGADPEAYDADIVGYVAAYKAFLRDYRIKDWLAIEQPIASMAQGYAGTLDRLGMIDGKLTIVDLKTGSNPDKLTCAAQLAGYRGLLECPELVGMPAGRYLDCRLKWLHLRKDGQYRLQAADTAKGTAAFNLCYLLHEMQKKPKKESKNEQ